MNNNRTKDDEKTVGKDRYRRLLRVIYHHTGGEYLPIAIPEGSVKLIYVEYTNIDPKTWRAAIKMAQNKQHVVRVKYDGEIRIALTVSGIAEIQRTTPYTKSDLERLNEIANNAVCSDSSKVDISSWVQEHKDYIKHTD